MICARKNKEEIGLDEKALNLKQIYKLKLTPERKVEAFRRFVIKLKQQKSYGRDLNYRDYFQVDVSLFREEALYMKDLDAEADTGIRLTKEIRCLEEMTDEQILCYYTLVKCFRNNAMERASMAYARYYMLEVVNLIYQETPEEAYKVLFSFWDALNGKKKVSAECTEYFYQICQLFMLAHQELMPDVVRELEARSGRDWTGQLFVQVEQGDYREAARFVQQNARLLKAEEIQSDAQYVRYTWSAMPYVFRALEEKLSDYDFRHVIMNGFYASVYIGDYPVKNASGDRRKQVAMSKYLYYEYQEYSDYWRFWYYVLCESVQDLLNVIRQYTRACVRQHLRLSGGKCTAVRLLKKNYMGDTEQLQDVEHLKEMAADPRFEAAVQEGVCTFLREHEIPLPERKRRKRVPPREPQDMDYGETAPAPVVDADKLRQAREDADSVLDMLSEGEIGYEEASLQEPEAGVSGIAGMTDLPERVYDAPGAAETAVSSGTDLLLTPEEWEYLRALRTGDGKASAKQADTLQMPENIMIRRINEKALESLGDVLLERFGGQVCIIEDYKEEMDRILGERP